MKSPPNPLTPFGRILAMRVKVEKLASLFSAKLGGEEGVLRESTLLRELPQNDQKFWSSASLMVAFVHTIYDSILNTTSVELASRSSELITYLCNTSQAKLKLYKNM